MRTLRMVIIWKDVCARVHMCAYVCACVHVCKYVRMHVCMCVCGPITYLNPLGLMVGGGWASIS